MATTAPRKKNIQKRARVSNPRKKNPDPISTFANLAVGVASALQINEHMKRKPKRNGRGRTQAKRNPRVSVPKAKHGNLYVLTISRGDDIETVYLHDGKGDGFSKKFKTMAGAKAYATRNKVKLNPNPYAAKIVRKRNVEGFVDGSGVFHPIRSSEDYDAARAGETGKARTRKKAAAKKAAPMRARKAPVKSSAAKKPVAKKKAAVRRPADVQGRLFNPKPTPRRRTFEMFQGRKATTAKRMPVSRHAPATLDQLGDLVELKLYGQPPIKFNGKAVKLCASRGRLWIAGKRFARPNPSAAANEINPVGEIDHVVYGTYKPHHGDMEYTHYIHKLGEESGTLPTLCVDREGFPVIRGGAYKIEARGIVD